MRQALLLLADSRLPAGGHAHSGGIAPAVEAELVGDEETAVEFLRGRLHTAGLLGGAVAARATALARLTARASTADQAPPWVLDESSSPEKGWWELDEEVDARTPSPAQRATSRAQGRALLRVAKNAFPSSLYASLTAHPHHPIVLGIAVHSAGGSPQEAAAIAVAHSINGPASAAIRLLGLDPMSLTAAQARLAQEADAVARRAASYTDELPAPSAPLLDLLAQAHARSEVRLFAS